MTDLFDDTAFLQIQNQLASQFANAGTCDCEIYVCFYGTPLEFSGFLVAARDDLNSPIAYCPMPSHVTHDERVWTTALMEQMRIALRIARSPSSARDAVDAVWLEWISRGAEAVPQWFYGLCCIPLRGRWNGRFLHPRPFCPQLFASMAAQPQAVDWIKKHAGPSAGG